MNQDKALFDYFRRHFSHFFPSLPTLHRTTFVRQAANLWKVKEALWQKMIEQTYCDTGFAIVDSFPVAVCKFARAPRCKAFRGEANFGKDHTIKQTFYGFRFHARVCWPGVITQVIVAPADLSDLAVVEEVVTGTEGFLLADRNYWKPELREQLSKQGVEMLVPYKKRSFDPNPEWRRWLSGIRYRIETVFSQIGLAQKLHKNYSCTKSLKAAQKVGWVLKGMLLMLRGPDFRALHSAVRLKRTGVMNLPFADSTYQHID